MARKRNEFVARGILPPEIADLLYPHFTAWDAPLIGDPGPPATIPGPDVFDLRDRPARQSADVIHVFPALGSNNWAVAGAHTATGRAIVANDPHMNLMVPALFFRVSLERNGRRVAGASRPGLPIVSLGSNGDVAWSVTYAYGDWMDIILLELDPNDANRYHTPDGWREIETVSSAIEMAGGATRQVTKRQTIWGPVVGEWPDGSPYVVRWPRGARSDGGVIDGMTRARNVEEAVQIAQRVGGLELNFVVGDAQGSIAWTILGTMPRRVRTGLVSYSGTGPAWDGPFEPEEYPLIINPPQGRIWTANNRVVDGEMLEKIGDGGHYHGARARQIRDRLMAIERATPADMLRI